LILLKADIGRGHGVHPVGLGVGSISSM
jgi:hypothetical protein